MNSTDLNSLMYLSILPAVLLLIYVYCRYKTNYWKRRGVQQLPHTNLIFGNFKDGLTFRLSTGCQIEKIHREAPPDAPYIGFYIFHKPCILLRDPDMIKQILIRDFDKFSERHFAGPEERDSTGMKNLFGLRNPASKYVRSKVIPTLSRSKLKQVLPLMLETGQPMIKYLRENAVDDQVIDVQAIADKYTADLIANVALGSKTDSFGDPSSEYSKLLVDFLHGTKRMMSLISVFFLPEVVQIFGHRVYFDISLARKLFWSAFESREKNGDKRGDYIDAVIQLKNGQQNPVFKFEGENLFHQAGIFFSGLESGASASAFTLMRLAKHKEYQDLAREDIKRAIDKHGWTYEAFNDMTYLDQCIAETIRLHPPVTTIDRCALKDYNIPNTDIIVEKGTPFYISVYGMHGDPNYFDEPELFKPERFDDNKKLSDAYIPFGAGPKMCIGMKYGKMHVKVILAMVLSEYEVYPNPEKEIYKLDTRSVFTTAADGINLRFKKCIK